MVATLQQELGEVEALVRAASGAARASLPPRFAATRVPLLREALSAITESAATVLAAWQADCSLTVRGETGLRRSSWQRVIRTYLGLLVASLEVASTLEADTGTPPEAAAAVTRLLEAFERLAADLSAARDDESWLALAVKWFPLDHETLSRRANQFVPPQEVYDEDWSDLTPAPEA